MKLSPKAKKIHKQISAKETKLGDLRKIAKEIKRDHDLAMELWSTGNYNARQLAILIMDKKQLDQALIDKLDKDIQSHEYDESNQLADWLMANQLTKDKKSIALILSWENSASAIQRRIFWYYQGRLRWVGQTPPDNTEELLASIEKEMANEVPKVQWAMNFTAGQIGTYDSKRRARVISLGKKIGLYKDDIVPRNCTPNYLPEFVKIQVEKLKK